MDFEKEYNRLRSKVSEMLKAEDMFKRSGNKDVVSLKKKKVIEIELREMITPVSKDSETLTQATIDWLGQ